MCNLPLFEPDSPASIESTVYDVYHDECKEDGFWHCCLFVPVEKKQNISDLIQETRKNLNYSDVIHYTTIKKAAKPNYTKVQFAKSLNTIACCAIQQQKCRGAVYLGHNQRKPIYEPFIAKDKIGAKLVIFRDLDGHSGMYSHMSPTQKFETTLRMSLKGGIHYFFDEEATINKIYHDYGSKVPFEQEYNEPNITTRLKNECNDQIKFTEDFSINTLDKRTMNPTSTDDNLLQLTDVVVGSVRTQLMNQTDFPMRTEISYPYRELLEKEVEVKRRMQNSRFYKGYSLTNAQILDDCWQFEPMKIQKQDNGNFQIL